MCQLTFADLGRLNTTYLTTQLVLNSLDNNPDGTGVFSEGQYWKTHLHAAYTLNLGTCIKDIVNIEPTVGHVRLASDKTLKEEMHSHPFAGSLAIQAHNGKLAPKDSDLLSDKVVDSLAFFIHLEELWKVNPRLAFPKALCKTMEEWQGKFAFMHYVKKTGDYFITRGRTADLYWTTVNDRLVVNTEEKTLKVALNMLNQIYQLTHVKPLDIGEIKEVEKESIFKFNPKESRLEKVGEITENTLTTTTFVPSTAYTPVSTATNLIPKLLEANNLCKFTFDELNYICLSVFGCHLIELSSDDLLALINDVLFIIASTVTNEKADLWQLYQKHGKTVEAYKSGIVFPWMFASTLKLKQKAKDLGILE